MAKAVTGRWRVAVDGHGVVTLIVTEASLFGYLILTYAVLGLQSPSRWPADGPPDLTWADRQYHPPNFEQRLCRLLRADDEAQ